MQIHGIISSVEYLYVKGTDIQTRRLATHEIVSGYNESKLSGKSAC